MKLAPAIRREGRLVLTIGKQGESLELVKVGLVATAERELHGELVGVLKIWDEGWKVENDLESEEEAEIKMIFLFPMVKTMGTG
jgi:hypothetical protein